MRDVEQDPGHAPAGHGRHDGDARPRAVPLDDERAVDAALVGAKAAALARAATSGLPVLPGFVVSTVAVTDADAGGSRPAQLPAVQDLWAELSGGGARPLVVRSSSPHEDLAGESMAGRFESVVGVTGWEEFDEAVERVLASRRTAAEGSALDPSAPIAVLVQPLLEAASGGVLFGIDPVTGREDRIVVAAVTGGPDRLVSGGVDGSRYELSEDGRVRSRTEGEGGAALRDDQLRRLAVLGHAAAGTFGGAQDVEWAFDADDELWLLQSRPVTTRATGRPVGPVLGPGPVAETFPRPLSRLEQDLWVEPLRHAVLGALRLIGTASERDLARSPIVVCIGGRVAVDLELFGEARARRGLRRLDPTPRIRRLLAAWRIGRLRAALPALAGDLVDRVDAELLAVPPVDELTDRQLVGVLERTRQGLCAVHGHEMLVGLLVQPGETRLTGTSLALRVLAERRAAGIPDADIVVEHPVVLALAPPVVAAEPLLPAEVEPPRRAPSGVEDDDAILREALRLRVRWLQELGARAAWELGCRLTAGGRLDEPARVRRLDLAGLRALVAGDAVAVRTTWPAETPANPLPARFRMSDTGAVIAVRDGPSGAAGTGAGGGTGAGPVHQGIDRSPPEGAVLVVRTLDPSIAPHLSRLAGLVAETGSVLAHLAILAREAGVPTVVGLAGALERFAEGEEVEVDGTTGDVRRR